MRKLALALALTIALAAAARAMAETSVRTNVCSDVPNAEQAFYLNFLGSLGYFRGDTGPGGPARPGDTITRAEYAVVVVRMLGKEGLANLLVGFTPPFADAAAIPSWALGAVNALVNLDVLRGGTDGLLRPNSPVTGAEAVAMLTRALQNDKAVTGVWPMNYLAWAFDNGLIDPLADVTSWKLVMADVPITRAQMAFLTYNALFIPRAWNPNLKPPDFTLPSLAAAFADTDILTSHSLATSKATFAGYEDLVDLAPVVTLYGGATLDAFLYRSVRLAFRDGRVVWLGADPGAVVIGVFKAWLRDQATGKWYIVLSDDRKVEFVPQTGGTTRFRVNGGEPLTYGPGGGVQELDLAGASLTIVLDNRNVATYVTAFKEDLAVCYVNGSPVPDTVATDDVVGRLNLAGDRTATGLVVTTSTILTGAATGFAGLADGDLVYVASVGMAGTEAYAIDVVKVTRRGVIDEVTTTYPGETRTVEFTSGSPVVLAGPGGAGYWGDPVSNANKDEEWTFRLDRSGKARLGQRVAGPLPQYPLVKIVGWQDRTKDRITVEDHAGNTFTLNVGKGSWVGSSVHECYIFSRDDIGTAGELLVAGSAEARNKTSGSDIEVGDVIGFRPFTLSDDRRWPPSAFVFEIYHINTATGEMTLGSGRYFQYLVNPRPLVYRFTYDEEYVGDGWLWPLADLVGLGGLKAGDTVGAVLFDPTGPAPELYYLFLLFWDNDSPPDGLGEDDVVWPDRDD